MSMFYDFRELEPQSFGPKSYSEESYELVLGVLIYKQRRDEIDNKILWNMAKMSADWYKYYAQLAERSFFTRIEIISRQTFI